MCQCKATRSSTAAPTVKVARSSASDRVHPPATWRVASLIDAVCAAIGQIECAVARGSHDHIVVAKARENGAHDKRASAGRQLADVVGAGIMDVDISTPACGGRSARSDVRYGELEHSDAPIHCYAVDAHEIGRRASSVGEGAGEVVARHGVEVERAIPVWRCCNHRGRKTIEATCGESTSRSHALAKSQSITPEGRTHVGGGCYICHPTVGVHSHARDGPRQRGRRAQLGSVGARRSGGRRQPILRAWSNARYFRGRKAVGDARQQRRSSQKARQRRARQRSAARERHEAAATELA